MHNSTVYKAIWGSKATSVGNSIWSSIRNSVQYFVVDSTKESLYELRKDSIRFLVAGSAKDYFKQNE
jgi:hypothetical protein